MNQERAAVSEQRAYGNHFACLGIKNARVSDDTLVESVTSEKNDLVEDVLGHRRADAAILSPFEELDLALLDNLVLFLADGLDAGVGAGQLDAAETVQDLHYLF